MPGAAMLLLTPSGGFGGGIERVSAAVEDVWPGPLERVDLYRATHVAVAAGQPAVKAAFAARVLATAARRRPLMVLAMHLGLLPVAHLAAAATGARVGVVAHGIESWGPMGPVLRRLVARCSVRMAVSTYTAQCFANRAGLRRDAVRILPLAVDRAVVDAAAQASPATSDDMLTVARLDSQNRYKGHFAIADAMPAILEQRPSTRWTVIGGGDDVERLREACGRAGIARAVDIRGEVSDAELHDAYARAGVFVLPSVADPDLDPPTGEGFGLVYAEAACFGVPSVAARAGGGSLDFVENGVTGLTIDPSRPTELAAAVTRLTGDREVRDRLGEAARRRVLARHLPEHFQRALVGAMEGR